MSYLQVLLPSAVAEEFADQMARQDIMQFSDLNEDFQPFQRKYTMDIVRIQDIERQIKTMEELLDNYAIFRDTEVTGEDLQHATRSFQDLQIIDSVAAEIGDAYKALQEQANIEQELTKQLSQQEDSIRVLQQIDHFLESEDEAQNILRQQQEAQKSAAAALNGIDNMRSSSPSSVPLLEVSEQKERDIGFKFFAGVVTIAQRVTFERQVFLTSRGNSFVQFDESVSDEDDKTPFVVFFLGDELKRSLKRLCMFMNILICYESDAETAREALLMEANSKRNDFYRIHSHTANGLQRDMKEISTKIKKWKIVLLQEKSIRITLNKFSVNQGSNNFLRAEGWCPTARKQEIEHILDGVTKNKGVGHPVVQDANPKYVIVPTHFETNSFTSGFQSIVDTYGIPRYKEFNPAVPTIVTFPFLFGVMYGDIFHGSCVFMIAILLLLGTKYYGWDVSRDENIRMFAGGRWIMLFMGICAIYCGLIYNDCMSIMINGWNKSQWGYGYNAEDQSHMFLFQKDTYAFGIDPVWHSLDNQLTYANSLKMKLSVIIGVIQMTFGLFLKLSNHIQERDMISIFCEVVPQFIFMMAFFGYMVFLIIYKWCIDWRTSKLPDTPSLITVLIKMILSVSSMTDQTQIFEDGEQQKLLQIMLLLSLFVSVPWMLIPKPLLLKRKHNHEMLARQMAGVIDAESGFLQRGGSGYELVEEDEKEQKNDAAAAAAPDAHAHNGEHFDFSEIAIHQMIHTIEYVLGTISNTASYLRLWALSLAHAQLSHVFYHQTIVVTLAGEATFVQIMMNVVAQFVFLMATIGVLLIMDPLECFLHALRLHWVEFQNKFFYADGVAFKPFSYRLLLEDD